MAYWGMQTRVCVEENMLMMKMINLQYTDNELYNYYSSDNNKHSTKFVRNFNLFKQFANIEHVIIILP